MPKKEILKKQRLDNFAVLRNSLHWVIKYLKLYNNDAGRVQYINSIKLRLCIHNFVALPFFLLTSEVKFIYSKVGLKIREANNGVGGKRLVCPHKDLGFFEKISLLRRSPLTLKTQLQWRKRDLCRASCPGINQHTLLRVATLTLLRMVALQLGNIISGTPTAPSLTGLRCKSQREITKRWKKYKIL